MRSAVMLVGLVACGRVGFDSGAGVDGEVVSGSAGDTCASAGVLAIGERLTGQSLANAANDIAVQFCPGGVEVVYALTSSTTAMRTITIDADFTGSLVVAQMCPPLGFSCTGFFTNMPQMSMSNIMTGTTYLIVEKSGGTGTTFSLVVQ